MSALLPALAISDKPCCPEKSPVVWSNTSSRFALFIKPSTVLSALLLKLTSRNVVFNVEPLARLKFNPSRPLWEASVGSTNRLTFEEPTSCSMWKASRPFWAKAPSFTASLVTLMFIVLPDAANIPSPSNPLLLAWINAELMFIVLPDVANIPSPSNPLLLAWTEDRLRVPLPPD